MNHVASVKDRLKNLSVASGKTMQELFVAYALERTIYRLSISKYVGNFVLKGGIFLYAIFDGNYTRATTDIDLLADHDLHHEDDPAVPADGALLQRHPKGLHGTGTQLSNQDGATAGAPAQPGQVE